MEQVKTFGEAFPKFLIELVADDSLNESFNLLVWDGARAHVDRRVLFEPGPGRGLASFFSRLTSIRPFGEPCVFQRRTLPTVHAASCSTRFAHS